MIVVQGHMRFSPGGVAAASDALKAMVAATRAEDGCLLYAFASDVTDPDFLHITERWRDQAAVDVHGASAHMAEFRKAVAAAQPLEVKVTLFDATEMPRG